MEQLQEALVPDLQAVLLVEHAQAMRHIVQSNIETVRLLLEAGGQRRLLTRHCQRLEDDIAGAERYVRHPIDEQQHREAHRIVYPVGIEEQRDGQWQGSESQLTDGDEGPPGVAA